MPVYTLRRTQLVPTSLDTLWDFISSPRNLQTITPDYMGFDIKTPDLPEKMYAGMIIQYTVRPILHIPMTWVTEITQVQPGAFFIDEQRVGPYKLWHHQHHLRPTDEGIEMLDIVTYQPPMGILGAFANALFIRRQLESIFEYRFKKIEELFPR